MKRKAERREVAEAVATVKRHKRKASDEYVHLLLYELTVSSSVSACPLQSHAALRP